MWGISPQRWGAVMNPTTFEAYRAARDAGKKAHAVRLLNALVIEETPLVERLARKLARGDYDDLRQVGLLALAAAIETYDPAVGNNIAAYARRKINSAFDREVIKVRPLVPADAKRNVVWGNGGMPKDVKRAEQSFVARHGRPPTAVELGVDAGDLAGWRSVTRFDEYAETDDEGGACAGAIAAAVQDTSHALSKKIRRTIGDMTLQEQRILLARAIEGLDFAVIGADEGLLRLTTWRIYERAIGKLRVALKT